MPDYFFGVLGDLLESCHDHETTTSPYITHDYSALIYGKKVKCISSVSQVYFTKRQTLPLIK